MRPSQSRSPRMNSCAWAWRAAAFDRLAGTDRLRVALDSGVPLDQIVEGWAAARQDFRLDRVQYLLYR